MNIRSQRLCAWGSPVGLVCFLVAIWPLAHFFPPLAPSLSATEVADIYRANSVGIRIACIVMILSCGVFAAFIAAIATQMKRIEGAHSPLTYTQIIAGLIGFLPLLITPAVWSVAAYRADRSPEMVMALNDLGWILFISVVWPPIVQMVAIGLAILGDKRPKPVFPRWAAYANFWTAILFLPGGFLTLFHTGPFAWNGLIAFWVPAVAFGNWLVIMFYVLNRAIGSQEAEGA